MIPFRFIQIVSLISLIIFMTSCDNHEQSVDQEPMVSTNLNYNPVLPSYFLTNDGGPLPTRITDHDNTPVSNPVTNAGAALGRVLFYDKNLSRNRTVACGNCHKAENGFSDSRVLSKGFEHGNTRRHSMSLIFARYYNRGRFFWDERAATLEEQVLKPIQDETEMGLTAAEISSRVQAETYYEVLFKQAFGDSEVSNERIANALAQFVRSMVSFNSKYDVGRAQVTSMGADFPNFTAQENLGKQLFIRSVTNGGGGCFGCHTTEAFINPAPGATNNGLDALSTSDLGVYEAIPNNKFLGAFKVPSLRNIADRATFMHDGRFSTLTEVVEHYNSGVKNHPNLAPALRSGNGTPIRLNFSSDQIQAIVAFLKTLSDESIATDERWSDPFK
ncbi:MAG: c-type cytochrome [Bacteroidetes bacterium]|nr:c-type cytochrome [Bacteroidota bacterium]